jgi:RNA polymerase sigma factor (sigma-70 family)
MPTSIHTSQLHDWLDRIRAGDAAAFDELLRGVSGKLLLLATRLLRLFPKVARWADVEDVLQNATLRLMQALKVIRPDSMSRFYGLAATEIRRELLDLARKMFHPARCPPAGGSCRNEADVAVPVADAEESERWCDFHIRVEHLPVEEREVVGLIFYHGWTYQQIAELFGVSPRTIARRWRSAVLLLRADARGEQA